MCVRCMYLRPSASAGPYVASPAAGPGSGPLRGVSWCLHARVLMQERACIVRGKKMEVDKRKKYVRWLSNQNAVSF